MSGSREQNRNIEKGDRDMAMILNEEQNMLKETAQNFCSNDAPIGQLRKLRDDDNAEGFDRDTSLR